MNTETYEVRNLANISRKELETGQWLKLPPEYEKKIPLTDADKAAVLAAEVKRLRKAAKRLASRIAP